MICDRRDVAPLPAFPAMDGGRFRSELHPGTLPDRHLLFYAMLFGYRGEPETDRERRMMATLELRRRQHMEAEP